LVDPVPLSPVSLVWRRGLRHPGLDALRAAARELAERHAWLALPGNAWWLPEADTRVMGVDG
ncbi:LysR family transcriptional regulator, partial [Streptomyces tubercidicus]